MTRLRTGTGFGSPPRCEGKTREEALQAIKDGEAPNHTPRSIFLHDTVKEEAVCRVSSKAA
jgi:hypothetical protein